MRAARQRWALSFADLCLLLLGFVLILQARPDPARLAAGLRGAMIGAHALPTATASADTLFEPGEALLSAHGHAFAAGFAHRAAGRAITIESRGVGRGSDRLDAWELAAARAAALARAVTAAGAPSGHVALSLEGADAPDQRLSLRTF